MKDFLKKLILTVLIVNQVLLYPQVTFADTMEVVDDDGNTKVVDTETRVKVNARTQKGDIVESNGKIYQITNSFEVDNHRYFLYTERGTTEASTKLTDPNGEGGKVLLENARQSNSDGNSQIDLSSGAPRTTSFSDGELTDIYHREGGSGSPSSGEMGALKAAAYNTEKQFFENYNNKLVSQSTEEVNAAKTEFTNYDLNSNAYPDVPVKDTDDGFTNFQRDNKPYNSSQAGEFEKLRQRLNNSIPKSPQHWNSGQAARKTIRDADDAYIAHNNELGDTLLKTSAVLVDIATDVLPITSIPKDAYRLLVGKDQLTGEELSTFERVLAGAFIAGAVLTVGATNTLKIEMKAAKAIAKATETEAKLAEKITQVIAKSPLTVDVLVKGTSGEFTLIGRDMVRVNEVSSVLSKEGITVDALNGFTKAANDEWLRLRNEYVKKPGDLIPYNVVETCKRYAENQIWIKDALAKGHTIIDLSNPMFREASAFYDMEKREILEYLKRTQKW